MSLKKLGLPFVSYLFAPLISNSQYGSVRGKNITLAKFQLLSNSKPRGYSKTLLIDIQKAYNSVDKKKLREKII
jgi:hypothetical protein